MNTKAIILFDGVCTLCNNAIHFIIRHDKKAFFKFASLQSEIGHSICLQYKLQPGELKSFVLIENGLLYTKSTAALRVIKQLNRPVKWLYLFILLPRFIRDFVYHTIAKNRYRWFGKQSICMVPSLENANRFII